MMKVKQPRMNNVDLFTFHCDIDRSLFYRVGCGSQSLDCAMGRKMQNFTVPETGLERSGLFPACTNGPPSYTNCRSERRCGILGPNLVPQAKNSGSGGLPISNNGGADSSRRDGFLSGAGR